MIDNFFEWIKGVCKSRLFPVVIIYTCLFSILIYRAFTLQIIEGSKLSQESEKKYNKERYIKSTRGNIYDCKGKLLAYNESSYSIVIGDSGELKKNDEKNAMIYKLINIVKKHKGTLDCDFEIQLTKDGKFEFTVDGTALLNFKRDVYSLSSVAKLTEEQKNATAEEIFNYLRYADSSTSPKFCISDEYTTEEALEIMAVRFEIFLGRYEKYVPVTVATDVSEETVAAIKENSVDLPGVDIQEETHRVYNDSEYFAQLLGYTGTISEEEFSKLDKEEQEKYTTNDQIGKTGLEKEFESQLHGTKGHEKLVLNQYKRIVDIKEHVEPVAGNDLYLTIDADLQKACYNMLEKKLAGILLSKIHNGTSSGSKGESAKNILIPIYDVYYAFIGNNIIDTEAFADNDATSVEKSVYQKFVSERKSVLNKLDTLLDVNSKTTNNKAPSNMEDYLSYIYTYLGNNDILLFNEIDESDSTFKDYKNNKISLSEFLQYAISNKWIDLNKIDIDNDYYSTTEIYQKLIDYTKKALKTDDIFTKNIYKDLVYSYKISGKEICLLLFDQGVLEYNEGEIQSLRSGKVSAYSFIRKKIQKREITPAQLALTPCSGSIVLTDVNTGQVKACVSYPGYDNNKMANKIDTEYYYKIYYNQSYPYMNRPTQQRTAPGSTFKIVSSVAALEEGKTTPSETIYDQVYFRKISNPPKCWSNVSHGKLNVAGAIEHSCNYYFYEMGWRLSNDGTNTDLGLKLLKKYASMFGLNATSGIEVSEAEPKISDTDAVRSAIGQGNNAFTPSQLSRYVTTIANNGTCYDLTVVDKIKDINGKTVLKNKAKVHNELTLKDSTWKAIHEGMYRVVNNSASLSAFFKGLDFKVAGKTGTAQESKLKMNHALFISYAPFKKPEISLTVVIPNGDVSSNAAELAGNVYKYYYSTDKKEKKALSQGDAVHSGGSSQTTGD